MNSYFIYKRFSLLLFLLISVDVIAAKQVHTDHPLIAAYEGSKIYSKSIKEYDEYQLFKGYDKAQKQYLTETLEGKITLILYTNPPERSALEIYRNYQQAVNKVGAEIIFECNQAKDRECIDSYVGANLRKKFNIHGIYNNTGRYMISKLNNDQYNAYLVIGVIDKYTDVHIIEMRDMETDKVTFNLETMQNDIDKQGFVIIEGLYFDTDKTELKPSSKAALDITASLLQQKPELHFLVVGHTDSQGELNYNMELSKGRANAVMSALVQDYAIAASRLSAHGVGPLAPIASNADASGMAKNRRVVLVQN